jgi:hypothetical protein
VPLGTGGRGGAGDLTPVGGLGFTSAGEGVWAVGTPPGEASRDTVREAGWPDWVVGCAPEAHPVSAAATSATASGTGNLRNMTIGCYPPRHGSAHREWIPRSVSVR